MKSTEQIVEFKGIFNDDTGDRCVYAYLVRPCMIYYEQNSSFSVDEIVENYILRKVEDIDIDHKLKGDDELEEYRIQNENRDDLRRERRWILNTLYRCKRKKSNYGWKQFYSKRIIDFQLDKLSDFTIIEHIGNPRVKET